MANIIQVDIGPFTGYGMYFFNAEPNQFVPTLVSQCLTSHVLEQTLILAKTLTSDPYKAGLLKTRISVVCFITGLSQQNLPGSPYEDPILDLLPFVRIIIWPCNFT